MNIVWYVSDIGVLRPNIPTCCKDWESDQVNDNLSMLPAKPDVTLTISDSDLVDMMSGRLNSQKAFFQGKLKVTIMKLLNDLQEFNMTWGFCIFFC